VPDTSEKDFFLLDSATEFSLTRGVVVSFWVYPDKTPGVKPMALGLEDKKAIVAEVTEAAKGALSAVAADSRGVTVAKMTALRKSAREAGVYMRVVRKTLLIRSVEGSDFECMKDVFVGPTLIAFSNEHPGAAARLFKEFAKANDKFSIKGGAFQGEFIPAAQIDRLATLPTYEEALAKLMATMKEAAAGKLVRTFAALRDKKEAEAA
jgi:large subunit ribosomal protein L10